MSITIIEAEDDPRLFAPHFKPKASWSRWRVAKKALSGLPMTEAEREVFREHAGDRPPPSKPVREGWFVVGRRGGKSRVAAEVAVYLACFKSYKNILASGERGTLMVIAADRRQARTCMRYIGGLIDGTPMLASMLEHRTRESIDLTNRITVEVHTASFRRVRGYTVVGCVLDEVAFWPTSDESAEPDREIVNALRPGMATVPGALLLGISSPYSRRGELWRAYEKHYGKDGDVLVWQAPTRAMNPNVPESLIAAAMEDDESSARAEYLAEFRRDIETFVSRETVDAATVKDRVELPPAPTLHRYFGFADPAGGSGGDSMTLGISHTEGEKVVLDLVREVRPPFSPDAVCRDFAATLKGYGVRMVTGDRYAGSWPAERFKAHGITYEASEKTKSEIYQTALPLLNSGRVELLDLLRLRQQVLGLERRTARSGRDSVDHGPRGHDDLINSACGALVLAASPRQEIQTVAVHWG